MAHRLFTFVACSILLTGIGTAAESASERNERMKWWREARFGMFVHWGLYSGLAGEWEGRKVADKGNMEWLQSHKGLDTYSYAKAAIPKFVPKPGFAKEWARLAKQAGCQYVVFTTKHHEGFALHDSKLTDFDAGDILNRDLVKEIVDALRAEGLRVGFYHSLIDWHHPQYDFTKAQGLPYPKGGTALGTTPRDHERYLEFLHGQANELVSNYGKIDILWWDYSSTKFDGDTAWRATDLMNAVRAKQPGVIMNNRLFRRADAGKNTTGSGPYRMDPRYGDFGTAEQHVPATGLGKDADWEACMTLNTTWGYSKYDNAWKSPRKLIRNLVDIASKGGNYLLNIGPKADGSLTPETVSSFQAIGNWMEKNSDAIRGTTAADFKLEGVDGRITTKGKTHFLILFERPSSGAIKLPIAVKSAKLDGSSLNVKTEGTSSTIELPATLPDPDATVIRLD
ncbi:MAG: alpha-L-fucosidase [Verrucomicrobiota bacterium]